MADPAQQTFSNVQPVAAAQTFSNVTPIGSTESPISAPSLTVGAPASRSQTADSMKRVYLVGGEPERNIAESVGQLVANSLEAVPTAPAVAHRVLQHFGIIKGGDLYENEPDLKDMPRNAVLTFFGLGDEGAEPSEGPPKALPKAEPLPAQSVSAKPAPIPAPKGEMGVLDYASLVPGKVGWAARILKKLGVGEKEIAAQPPVTPTEFETLQKSQDFGTPQELRGARIPTYPGAPNPLVPAPEVLNPALVSPARTLPGMSAPEVIRPPAQPIPARTGLQLTGETAQEPTAPPVRATEPEPEPGAAQPSINQDIPRTPSGEGALKQILLAQENANLLKIARSRGIDVTPEAQLKAGVANPRIINKIVDDFSDDELDNVRSTWMEMHRFTHDYEAVQANLEAQGVKGEALADRMQEFYNTKALQTYFPDVKIPAATLARTQALANAPQPAGKVTPIRKVSPSPPAAPGTVAPPGDLTSIIEESLRQVLKKKQVPIQ